MKLSQLMKWIKKAYEDEGRAMPKDPTIRFATNWTIENQVASVYMVDKSLWVDLVPNFDSRRKVKP